MSEITYSKKINSHSIGGDAEYKSIRQTKATWEFLAEDQATLNAVKEIFESQEGAFQLILYENGTEFFRGVAAVDEYQELDQAFPISVEVHASDLAILKNTETTTTGRSTIIEYVAALLQSTGIELNINVIQNYVVDAQASSPLELVDFSLATFRDIEGKIDDKYSALEKTLKPFGLELFQYANAWWIIHHSALLNSAVNVDHYDSSGVFLSSENINIEVSPTLLGGNTKFLNRGYKNFILNFNHGVLAGNMIIPGLDWVGRANWEEIGIFGGTAGAITMAIAGNPSFGRIIDPGGTFARFIPNIDDDIQLFDVVGGIKNVFGFINFPDLTGITISLTTQVRGVLKNALFNTLNGFAFQFKFKIGNYYLKKDGSWTLTENIIQLGGMGGQGTDFSLFKALEIKTEEIPENGDIDIQVGGLCVVTGGNINGYLETQWYPIALNIMFEDEGSNASERIFELTNNKIQTFDTFDFGETRVGTAITPAQPGGLLRSGLYDLAWENPIASDANLEFLTLINFFAWLGEARNKYDINYKSHIALFEILIRDSVRYRILDQESDHIRNQSKAIILEISTLSPVEEYSTATKDVVDRTLPQRIITDPIYSVEVISDIVSANNPISLDKSNQELAFGLNVGNHLNSVGDNLNVTPSTLAGNNLNPTGGQLNVEPTGSEGEIQFVESGELQADINLFWDNLTKRLGINNQNPEASLDIIGDMIVNDISLDNLLAGNNISLEGGAGTYKSIDGSSGTSGSVELGDGTILVIKQGIITEIAPPFLPEAVALFAGMDVQPSAAAKTAYNDFIGTLIDNGIWAKMHVLYVMDSVHDEQASRLNFIDPATFLMTKVGSPTFGAHGWQGDTSNYLNTGYNPNTYPSVQNNAHVGLFIDTVGQYMSGAYLSAGGRTAIYRTTGDVRYAVNQPGLSIIADTVNGMQVATRNIASSLRMYADGNFYSLVASSTTPPNLEFYLCTRNFNGSPSLPTTTDIGYLSHGEHLTDADITTLHTALLTLIAAL